ncbi:MAG: terpene cyclase/mutase family protein [Planctomycetes bacterium]|nr:terpene cyclase/mutase family protein [Planctomycetota bacterium]
MRTSSCFLFAVVLTLTASASADEGLTLANVPAPPPLVADEPLARAFSLKQAARSLDTAALHWQKTRKCAACHTLPPYLMARPFLAAVSPEPPEVRRFFETIVEHRLEGEPSLPKDGVSAVVIEVAAALAFHDRATTGKLHPRTRQELDRMWTLQRPDGSWEWPFRDTPPRKIEEHYGVTLAALSVGLAPDGYARTEAARKGLAGVRKFLKAHPPTSLHHQAMLLWASLHVEDLVTPKEKEQTLLELKTAQRPDGGWSLASLVDNSNDPRRQTEAGRKARAEKGHGHEFLVYVGRDKVYRSSLASDGYATGLVMYVLRQAGVPAADPRLRRGVAWLKSHQRESGRWFTPSQAWHTQHRIANAGTAFAVLALHACGEIPGPQPLGRK